MGASSRHRMSGSQMQNRKYCVMCSSEDVKLKNRQNWSTEAEVTQLLPLNGWGRGQCGIIWERHKGALGIFYIHIHIQLYTRK
jgi:hypothetical protein